MSYRQYVLRAGNSETTGWLETDGPLSEGQRLTLKGDDRVWTVVSAGRIELKDPPERKWQVGGLR